MSRVTLSISAGFALLAAGWMAHASAQGAPDFYKGKQITMLVASVAGGGYDTYARTLARHMSKHIPGNPVIVPKNLPGAGGLVGASTLYNNAPRDGLTFAALTNGIALDPLFKKFPGRFEPLKFAWLGSIGKLMNVCVTWHTSPVTTIAQAQQREVIVSASGATSNSVMMPKITNALLGTKFKVVTGYADPDVTLAMERGEVEGVCGLAYTTLKGHAAGMVSRSQDQHSAADRSDEISRSAERAERPRSGLQSREQENPGTDPHSPGDGPALCRAAGRSRGPGGRAQGRLRRDAERPGIPRRRQAAPDGNRPLGGHGHRKASETGLQRAPTPS